MGKFMKGILTLIGLAVVVRYVLKMFGILGDTEDE